MTREPITKTKVGIYLLFGALLLTAYLCNTFPDFKTLHRHYFANSTSQTKAPAKSNYTAHPYPRCQQNLSVANQSDFSTFTPAYQDFLYLQHCRHFPVLLDVPDKCGGAAKSADVFLLLVIKSSPDNYDRREVMRKTWARERLQNGVWIRRMFIIGTSRDPLTRHRTNTLLKFEQRGYKDILQWDFVDSFMNLTLKQVLFLEWMERNCPHARFLLNGDDEIFAHTDNIVNYLRSLTDNDGSKHLYMGRVMVRSPTIRAVQSKYFVSHEVYNQSQYPPYCSGGGYILSGYTASVIYKMSQSINIIPIDDAYMGMCLAKAQLSPSAHKGVHPYAWRLGPSKLNEFDPCHVKDDLLVHGFQLANMFFMWQRLHDPNLKCDSSGTNDKLDFKW